MESLPTILEITGTLLGFIYIFQAARLKRDCWIYGGISSVIFTYLFFQSKLYVDGSLNAYYVLMAFVGWFQWNPQKTVIAVSTMSIFQLLFAVIITIGMASSLAFIMYTYTDASYPIMDSFVGAFSITATWLTTRRKIENWPFWIFANALAIALFLMKGIYYVSVLMAVYFILSITGWIQWKKEMKHA